MRLDDLIEASLIKVASDTVTLQFGHDKEAIITPIVRSVARTLPAVVKGLKAGRGAVLASRAAGGGRIASTAKGVGQGTKSFWGTMRAPAGKMRFGVGSAMRRKGGQMASSGSKIKRFTGRHLGRTGRRLQNPLLRPTPKTPWKRNLPGKILSTYGFASLGNNFSDAHGRAVSFHRGLGTATAAMKENPHLALALPVTSRDYISDQLGGIKGGFGSYAANQFRNSSRHFRDANSLKDAQNDIRGDVIRNSLGALIPEQFIE